MSWPVYMDMGSFITKTAVTKSLPPLPAEMGVTSVCVVLCVDMHMQTQKWKRNHFQKQDQGGLESTIQRTDARADGHCALAPSLRGPAHTVPTE